MQRGASFEDKTSSSLKLPFVRDEGGGGGKGMSFLAVGPAFREYLDDEGHEVLGRFSGRRNTDSSTKNSE